jgi:hypothetical protein
VVEDRGSLERYIAVDPGVVTGLVQVDLPGNWRSMDLYKLLSALFQLDIEANLKGTEWPGCRAMELHGYENGQIDEIERLIFVRKGRLLPAKSVIIEDFILRERTQSRSLLAPVRITAALTDRLYSKGYRGEVVLQSPSDAKSIVTDSRLKAWGLWHEGSPHIRDAWRHLVKYLRENRA